MALGYLNPHLSQIWWVFLLKGLAGIVLGFMLLTEPAATLVALTTLLGFYWLVLGVLSLVQVGSLDSMDLVTPNRHRRNSSGTVCTETPLGCRADRADGDRYYSRG